MPPPKLDAGSAATLNRLLDEALELPLGERVAWLEGLPATCDALKPHLRDLLGRAATVESADFLGSLPRFAPPGEVGRGDERALDPGMRVGPYRLVRALGQGGMGSVWLAERGDGQIHRQVALKLPHRTLPHARLGERLQRERDILATLEHPGIARLYDAGLTDDGQPYLALEYIEGRPIDAWCRLADEAARLPVADRVRLFLQVARAVAYAHGKLVLHRDLKPANILVTEDGTARLLDFGIAKLLEEGEARETRLTQFAGRALSPDYASPEQIRGEALSVTSDIYSAGIVLYELLAGARPYRLTRNSRGELEDAILFGDPRRPSELAAAEDRSAVRGDLDTIVMKSIRKAPGERYSTMQAFIDDLERALDGRPVSARPDTFSYRAGKFVRRHKVGVTATCLVLLAILAGAGLALWQARIASANERRALAVKNFITGIFLEADPTTRGDKPLTAVELLKQAETSLQSIPATQPELRVELQMILGESLLDLQDNDSAARVLGAAVAEGERTLGPQHEYVIHSRLKWGAALGYLGKYEQSRAELDRVLAAIHAARRENTADYSRALAERSAAALDDRDYELAEKQALEALAVGQRTAGARTEEVSTAQELLALIYRDRRRFDLASQYAGQAYQLALSLHQANPRHPQVIDAEMTFADILYRGGEVREAVKAMSSATASAEEMFGQQSMMVGFSLRSLADMERDLGRLSESLEHGRRSLAIAEAQKPAPDLPLLQRETTVARTLLAERRVPEALAYFERALVTEKRFKDSESGHWALQACYGDALARAGQAAAALKVLQAIPLDNASLSALTRLTTLRSLGVVHRKLGHRDEAMSWLKRAVADDSSRQPAVQLEFAQALSEIAELQLLHGARADAVKSLEAALRIVRQWQSAVTPLQAEAEERLRRAQAR